MQGTTKEGLIQDSQDLGANSMRELGTQIRQILKSDRKGNENDMSQSTAKISKILETARQNNSFMEDQRKTKLQRSASQNATAPLKDFQENAAEKNRESMPSFDLFRHNQTMQAGNLKLDNLKLKQKQQSLETSESYRGPQNQGTSMGRDTHYRFGNLPLDRISEKVHRPNQATPLRSMKVSPSR